MARQAWCLLGLVVSGCAPRPVRLVVVTSSVAQTVSFLGDTLYSLPRDARGGPARVRRIIDAREAVQSHPGDLRAVIRLGRSTVAMGRLRDAVELYNKAAAVHFGDPRLYRERGEVLLRLRHLDPAIKDFREAGLLLIGRVSIPETTPEADETLGEGAQWISISTVQYQTYFLLGFALYCKGDYKAAREVLVEAAGSALTPDELARALLWLFFTVRRIGNGGEAATVLAMVEPAWAEHAYAPEVELLRAYKGSLPTDSILRRSLARTGDAGAIYSYGIGYSQLLDPSRRADAELWLERARSGPDWSAIPFLAAEADLARLRSPLPSPPLDPRS